MICNHRGHGYWRINISSLFATDATGRWTHEEHELFIKGLRLHNKQWKLIAELIQTRTIVQIRTHAQKYFQKLIKMKGESLLSDELEGLTEDVAVEGTVRIYR